MVMFIGKRLLSTIPTLVGVAILVFLMLQIVPGDPVTSIVSPDASAEERLRVQQELGLDKPLIIQFLLWIGYVLQGDLGTSISKNMPVVDLLLPALINTLILSLSAVLFAFIVGSIIGIYSAYYPKSTIAKVFNWLGLAGIGIPNFWAGLILIGIFSVSLGWLPSSGVANSETTTGIWNHLKYLILPTIAASLTSVGMITRMVRNAVQKLLQQDFVFALRAKGLNNFKILKHVLKNSLPNILTVTGLQLGYLIGGSVLVETVFAWPGIGQLIYLAISSRDFPVVQAGILVVAIAFVLINLLVDAIHAMMDPRVRQ